MVNTVSQVGFTVSISLSNDTSIGPIVRIAPNHVSIASLDAVNAIYGHGAGLLKSDYYDAFVSFNRPSIFTTRSRAAHTRKRKLVSHLFAQRSLKGFEESVVRRHLITFVQQWDQFCDKAKGSDTGLFGSCAWRRRDGRVWFDAMPCQSTPLRRCLFED